jgi:hypothetical protein
MAQARRPNSASAAASAAAELAVIADTIERHRERVAALAIPFLGTEREDIVISIHEAERQLLIAARTLRRGVKSLER